MTLREISRILPARETRDGAGVRLVRTIGTPSFDHLDPFLLLDEFRSEDGADYVAGFPDHPHRGFETVTYMLAGAMHHKDHAGNEGHLRPGSVQWMTAGRGIVHSEMPEQREGLLHGFQLWVNLPAKDKMCPPRYQDVAPEDVPEVRAGEATVRILAGELGGTRGAIGGIAVQPTYLDVHAPPGTRFEHDLPAGHNAFVYVYEGELSVGAARLGPSQLGVLSRGELVSFEAGTAGASTLLIAGAPIGETIARHGPFVMNTHAEIEQAILDFREGRLG